jgi:hypothetical protein
LDNAIDINKTKEETTFQKMNGQSYGTQEQQKVSFKVYANIVPDSAG